MLELGVSYSVPINMQLRKFAELAVELGASVIELQMDHPQILMSRNQLNLAETIREIANDFSLTVGIHAPYIDVNPATLNRQLQTAVSKILQNALYFAEKAGAVYLLVHPGYVDANYSRQHARIARENALKMLRGLVKSAEDSGIVIAVENLPKSAYKVPLACTPNDLQSIVSYLDVHVVLDLGHANTVMNALEFVKSLPQQVIDKVYALHVHDNDGSTDAHLPLGRGNVQYDKVIDYLVSKGFRGPAILEVHDQREIRYSAQKLDKVLKGQLMKLMSSKEQRAEEEEI